MQIAITITVAVVGMVMLIWFLKGQQKKSTAVLHFGNIPIEDKDQVNVYLTYRPGNPILFLSEKWNILGGTSIKEEVIEPELKSRGERSYSFSFTSKLSGISDYKLQSIHVNCEIPGDKTISFYINVTLDTVRANYQGWVEGQSMQENNGIARLVHVSFENSDARFRDHSKDEFYQFFEKDKNGSLQLDEENRPVLLADSLPKVQAYLLKTLSEDKTNDN